MAKQAEAAKSDDLSIKDTCRLLQVSDMTLYNWREGKTEGRKIPHRKVKVGERHRVTFPRDKLKAFISKAGLEIDKKVAKELRFTLQ